MSILLFLYGLKLGLRKIAKMRVLRKLASCASCSLNLNVIVFFIFVLKDIRKGIEIHAF